MIFNRKSYGFSLLFCSLIVIIFLCLAGSAGIWASEPKYGGTLRVAITSDPPGIDPMANTHGTTKEIALHIFEPLVALNDQYEVMPMLAKDWDISDNGKVYTFYLRDEIHFHNGQIMTADDVKASIERYLEIAPKKNNFVDLEEINIIDDYTIELKLSTPLGAFLTNLATPANMLAIMPKDVIEKSTGPYDIEIIGTGPYQLDEWLPDRHVKLKRFDDYKPIELESSGYGGYKGAYLDEIYFITVSEPGSRVVGLETGEYDYVDGIPSMEVSRLRENGNLIIEQIFPYRWPVLYFNFSEHGVFSNLKLRQALQAGLDLEEIMIVATDGTGRLDPGMNFKEQIWWSDVGKELYNQNDPEKAKRLVKEAGYDGEEIVFLNSGDIDYMYKTGIALESQMRELGFNIRMTVTDWPTLTSYRADLTYWDIAMSAHDIRYDPSVTEFYFVPETTFFAYDNPEMVEALIEGKRSTDFEDRYKAYEKVQRIFYDDVAMLKFFDLGIYQGIQKYVQHEFFETFNLVNTWLDK